MGNNTQIQVFAKLADDTATQITGSYQEWTAFLTTAARLYKYPYPEQLMIYAQRPEATACASYDVWNRRMGRYIRRGSQGIALIDMTGDRPRLRYVFDVADTGNTERSRLFEPWEYKPEHEKAVSAMLERRYDVTGEHGIEEQFEKVAAQLADEYWYAHQRDILSVVDDSFLFGYDDFNVGVAFRNAATVSITYGIEGAACNGLKIQATELEYAIFDVLKKQVSIIFTDRVADLTSASNEKVSVYEQQLSDLREQKMRLYERYVSGELDADSYKREKAAVDTLILKSKNAYSVVTTQAKQAQEQHDMLIQRNQIVQEIAAADRLTQRLTDLLIDRVYVYPDKRIEIHYKIDDIFADVV